MRADMLPIYTGYACSALLFARGVLGVGLGGDARGNIARVVRRWLPAAAVALAVAAACQVALPRLGREQCNLAELLRTDRLFPAAWLVAICLWVPATAGWAAADWSAGRRISAAAWAPASLLVSWGLLRYSATVESIDDILGSPITEWPLDLEYIARLAAVYFPFAWAPLLIPPLALRSRAAAARCAAASAAVVLASWAVVQGYSHADNVSELFRPDGECLFGAGCLAARWAAMLCARAGAVRGAVVAVTMSVPAWWAANMSVRVESVHGVSAGFAAFCAAFVFFATCAAPGMRAGRPTESEGQEGTGAILARVEASMDAQDRREYGGDE